MDRATDADAGQPLISALVAGSSDLGPPTAGQTFAASPKGGSGSCPKNTSSLSDRKDLEHSQITVGEDPSVYPNGCVQNEPSGEEIAKRAGYTDGESDTPGAAAFAAGSPSLSTDANVKVHPRNRHHIRSRTWGSYCSNRLHVLAMATVVVLLLLLLLALGLRLGLSPLHKGRTAIGGVAADHSDCSKVGRDFLEKGGSAVDATIAALLCNGIRQPHSMGIGGGVFIAVYRKKDRSVEMFDGREVAPMAASQTVFFNQSFVIGNLSIAVPGEIRTYWEVHQKYGRLPWRDLFQPAIKMAAEGHLLSVATANALVYSSNFKISDYPGLCALFCDAGGAAKKAGDTVKMTQLAKTLQGVAENGPDYLYNASFPGARHLLHDVKNLGSLLTMADMENYKVVKNQGIAVPVGDLTLHTFTAPSSGPVLALALQILDGLNLKPEDLHKVSTTAAMLHLVVEAIKFAYADRLQVGDPAFVPNMTELVKKMISPDHVRKLRQAIDRKRTFDVPHYTNLSVSQWPLEGGTTHISVIGPDGDAVSATSTINYYFGSLLVSDSTGIILNNEMADFAVPTEPANESTSPNAIQPGKRALSSMAPVIITDKDGNPRLVLGGAGGARITNAIVQVIVRVLWLKQSLKDAILSKRLHHALLPNTLIVEEGIDEKVAEELMTYGHQVIKWPSYMAVVQGVSRDPSSGEITAFSDPRKHAEACLLYDKKQ